MGRISDPAALSIVWRAALGVLVASTSMLLDHLGSTRILE
jgi:hypothetical protein